jgi:hypothetical protein
MTEAEILKSAEERYKIFPSDCRRERQLKNHLRMVYIEKLKKKYGLLKGNNKVN